MAEFLFPLMGVVIGLVGGYVFGVAQARAERRDSALAEIFKEMMLFYRSVVAWTSEHDTTGPIVDPESTWKEFCRKQYEVFLDAFYGNAIWLGSNTEGMIEEFAHAGKDLLNHINNDGRRMKNGESAWDWRKHNLAPKLTVVRDALRAEVETSRYIIPYRVVVKRNERNDQA